MRLKLYRTVYFCNGYDNDVLSATYEDAVSKVFHLDDILADNYGGIREADIYEVEYEVDFTQNVLNGIMSDFHGNICMYVQCCEYNLVCCSSKKVASMEFPQE